MTVPISSALRCLADWIEPEHAREERELQRDRDYELSLWVERATTAQATVVELRRVLARARQGALAAAMVTDLAETVGVAGLESQVAELTMRAELAEGDRDLWCRRFQQAMRQLELEPEGWQES